MQNKPKKKSRRSKPKSWSCNTKVRAITVRHRKKPNAANAKMDVPHTCNPSRKTRCLTPQILPFKRNGAATRARDVACILCVFIRVKTIPATKTSNVASKNADRVLQSYKKMRASKRSKSNAFGVFRFLQILPVPITNPSFVQNIASACVASMTSDQKTFFVFYHLLLGSIEMRFSRDVNTKSTSLSCRWTINDPQVLLHTIHLLSLKRYDLLRVQATKQPD